MHFYTASLQSVGPHPLSGTTDYYSILFLLCPQCCSHWMGAGT